MKCRHCAANAVIQLRQHRLSLCGPHFEAWFLTHCAGTLRRYRMVSAGDRVLVAVSGGKDSLALWQALSQLGVPCEGLYLQLGIDEGLGYSERSLEKARLFAGQRGLTLHILRIAEECGETVPGLFRRTPAGEGKPCSTCGLVKRHELNRFALENGFNVLATGHNLDDEAGVLFSNLLSWNTTQLARQAPVMEGRPGLARRIKPLVRFYERETAAYAIQGGIDYQEEECPFSAGSATNRNKELLNQLEHDQPGLKYRFYLSFLEQQKAGRLMISEDRLYEERICPACGGTTSRVGLCAFCNLVGKGS